MLWKIKLCLLCVFLLVHRAGAQDIDKAFVADGFKQYRDKLLDQLYVRYSVVREVVNKKEMYQDMPLGTSVKDAPLLLEWQAEHAWHGDFSRDITVGNLDNRDLESIALYARFSRDSQTIVASRESVVLGKGSRWNQAGQFKPEEEQFLEALGVPGRRRGYGPTLAGNGTDHEFDPYAAILKGGYALTIDVDKSVPNTQSNSRLFTFDLPGVDHFVLAETFGFAVKSRRWIWGKDTNNPGAVVEIENSDWMNVDRALWIPKTIQIKYHPAPGNEISVEERITVVAATVNTTDDMFIPKISTGAVIVNPDLTASTYHGSTREDVLRYLADPGTSELEDTTAAAKRFANPQTTSRRWLILLGINVAVVIGVVAFVFFRRKER